MKKSFLMLLCFAALLVTALATSAQAPRTVANDDFSSATTLVPGKSYTVKGAETASIEPDQPFVIDCPSGSSAIHKSVWYRVTTTSYMQLHLSTYGSIIDYGNYGEIMVEDTKLAVFTGSTLHTLSQVACNDDAGGQFSELSFSLNPGQVYYILLGTYIPSITAASYQLTTRVLGASHPVPNTSFEQSLNESNWKTKNLSGDGVVCGDPTYYAFNGACAFRFVGGTGENSQIVNTFSFAPDFAIRKKGSLSLTLYYQILETVSLGNTKIKLTVSYKDGTPSVTKTLNLTGKAAEGAYKGRQWIVALKSAKVDKVKFAIKFKSTEGVLLVDSASVVYTAGSSTRDAAAPLALPPALASAK